VAFLVVAPFSIMPTRAGLKPGAGAGLLTGRLAVDGAARKAGFAMPDTSPPSLSTAEEPPPEDGWRPDLGLLRAQLDELDDKIHDLLMQRASVVEGVARTRKAAAFRPGREASILRRLLARHRGELPARTLVRMWRELFAGTTAMQTDVSVAVAELNNTNVLNALAREHFGFLTPVPMFPSATAALDAVRTGLATLAVLPFPTETNAWWPALRGARPHLHIIARLPFWNERRRDVPTADALVVGRAAPDASGIDRSFLVAANHASLTDAGLTVRLAYGDVAEVEGMVLDGDPRLPASTVALGGYAVPVPGE